MSDCRQGKLKSTANAGPNAWRAPQAGRGDSPRIDQARLAQAVAAPLVNGVQAGAVVVNGHPSQYEPAAIKGKQGIPARFNLSANGEPGCRRPVVLRRLGARGLFLLLAAPACVRRPCQC